MVERVLTHGSNVLVERVLIHDPVLGYVFHLILLTGISCELPLVSQHKLGYDALTNSPPNLSDHLPLNLLLCRKTNPGMFKPLRVHFFSVFYS